MIYTVTFNPAIDYVMRLKSFLTGTVNRSDREEINLFWRKGYKRIFGIEGTGR